MHDWAVTLPKSQNLFIRGKANNYLFGSKDLSFSVVAPRLKFRQSSDQVSFAGFLHRLR